MKLGEYELRNMQYGWYDDEGDFRTPSEYEKAAAAEIVKLRAALECVPTPAGWSSADSFVRAFKTWYNYPRAEALNPVKENPNE